MKSYELETLLADYEKRVDLNPVEYISQPSVESQSVLDSSYPDAVPGWFCKVEEDGHYYIYNGAGWDDLGSTRDEAIEIMQTDIDSLKLSTGMPVDLTEYVKKESITDDIPTLEGDEILNILKGE